MTIKNFSLQGRVAVVTGSGRGIGRACVVFLAKAGAQVVVNDLGTEANGSGDSQKIADSVVEEIRKAGGKAVANYENVATMEGGRHIAECAMDNFGRIDILVNNAGILRDKMFIDMTEEDWDMVIAVHLKGHFCCTKAVLPQMVSQKYGRIINISSGAALGAPRAEVNYASAKAGILGFTRSLAKEVKEYGITVNAVMPTARTRLADDVLSKGLVKQTSSLGIFQPPEVMAPIIAYLASEEAGEITGFTFAARFKGTIQLMSNPTAIKGMYKDGVWTVEELSEIIPKRLLA